MSDNFEFFLQLEDVQGTGLNPETSKAIASELKEVQAERVAKEAEAKSFDFLEEKEAVEEYENPFDDDFEIDREFKFEDDTDFTNEEETPAEQEEVAEEETEEDATHIEGDEGEEIEAYDVDFDTLITLPDGTVTTIEDLSTKAKVGAEFEQKQAELDKREREFNQLCNDAQDLLSLKELEIDTLLADYQGFDWDGLGASDPSAYFEHQKYVQSLTSKKQRLINEKARLDAQKEQQEQATFITNASECVKDLKASIPEWSDSHYGNLMTFAIDNGEDPKVVEKEIRPAYWKMVHKLYKFEKGIDKVKAKVQGAKGKRNVVTPGAAQVRTNRDAQIKAEAAARYSKGHMSQEDAFKFLED